MPFKKIGIFGGTFNPVHLGHLRAALEVQRGFGLDAVFLIPSASPPHKEAGDVVAAADRLEMVRRCVSGVPGLRVSDIELKREGPSYTIDTICAFRQIVPQDVWLYLIIGLDAFEEIATWKSYEDLLRLVPLIVISRPGVGDDPQGLDRAITRLLQHGELAGYACAPETPCFRHCEKQPIFTFNVTAMDIASSRIRGMVKQGEPIDFLVPEAVNAYIKERGLYR
jgi:nicotinate-nucleotide adenylyltransferase